MVMVVAKQEEGGIKMKVILLKDVKGKRKKGGVKM